MAEKEEFNGRKALAWALYDWANSAFATAVMAAFFPIFFKEYWNAGANAAESTFRLGAANSLASAVVVFLAPVLGAAADRGGARKKFLFFFSLLGVLATGSLALVGSGSWEAASFFFVLAAIGFSGGNVFYDALLVDVAGEGRADFVSALGYSLGYLGGGLLFVLDAAMLLSPSTFGLESTEQAMRAAFLSVALWWALFALPLFLFVDEPRVRAPVSGWQTLGAGLDQLRTTFAHIRRLRVVFLFLLGYWLYIDGVDTIVRMAVDYGLSLGFPRDSLLIALGITQFVGFPAALGFGWLGGRLGPRAGIYIGIGAYVGATCWGFFMEEVWEFYLLAAVIGLVQGGVQSLSRSLYTRLIPRDKAAEFFGFYNMLGKFAAVFGPLLMGGVGLATGNPRYALLSLLLLFGLGAFFLSRVNVEEGRRMAAALENVPG